MNTQTTTTHDDSDHRLVTADAVHGWDVADLDGKVLGTVSHVLFDLARGNLAYAIVASGGFLGVGERRIALAWESLAPGALGDRRLIWNGAASVLIEDLPRPVAAYLSS